MKKNLNRFAFSFILIYMNSYKIVCAINNDSFLKKVIYELLTTLTTVNVTALSLVLKGPETVNQTNKI